MINLEVLAISESEIKQIPINGLLAIGGTSSSGIKLKSLKSKDDYAVLSTNDNQISVHALRGKQKGGIKLKAFEKCSLEDLILIALPNEKKTITSNSVALVDEQKVLSELHSVFTTLEQESEVLITLENALNSLLSLFQMEKGFIVSKLNKSFEIVTSHNVNPNDPWLSETFLVETLNSDKPLFVQNLVGSAFEKNKSLVATGFLSVFSWPLKFRGEILGAIVVGSTKPHSSLNSTEKQSAELFAKLIAYALSIHLKEKKYREQIEALKQTRSPQEGPFLTQDKKVNEIVNLAQKVAKTELSLLIQGETGVGKEVLARWIHSQSDESKGPFVAVNCGAIPENLIESVLFGHKKGAFTGAQSDQIGKFQLAHGGTLFLDEIGDLPQAVQVKLLRAIQERVVDPIGSSKPIPVKVRIISASLKRLDQLVQENKFREDLYYRLADMAFEIPPLRERPSDIGLIATKFLKDNYADKSLSTKAWSWLRSQTWPGNIRELLSSLKRAAILSNGTEIQIDDFTKGTIAKSEPSTNWLGGKDLSESTLSFLKSKVDKALQLTQGNKKQAAELLGITPRTLFRYLEDFRENGMTDLSH